MDSLIKEIQRDIINNKESVTSILRKAKLLATKLESSDFLKWINYELEGYPDKESLPKYRIISGEMKAYNPLYGYIPIYFKSPKQAETFSNKPVYDSIITIEKICNEQDSKGEIESPIPHSIKMQLLKITEGMEPTFLFNQAQFLAILENVKNKLLDWVSKLQTEGVLVENLNSTAKEKEIARTVVLNIEQMNNSQIQLETINSIQNYNNDKIDIEKILSFLKEIEDNLANIKISNEACLEIKTDIKTIKTQLESPNPKRGILVEALNSIRNILEGAAGSLIASGLLYQLSLIIPK